MMYRSDHVFHSQDHKHFYCRYSDPSYIKQLKLEMLTAVADSNNVFPIVVELSEYAGELERYISSLSYRANPSFQSIPTQGG
jgi:vesicle coat complex subunit